MRACGGGAAGADGRSTGCIGTGGRGTAGRSAGGSGMVGIGMRGNAPGAMLSGGRIMGAGSRPSTAAVDAAGRAVGGRSGDGANLCSMAGAARVGGAGDGLAVAGPASDLAGGCCCASGSVGWTGAGTLGAGNVALRGSMRPMSLVKCEPGAALRMWVDACDTNRDTLRQASAPCWSAPPAGAGAAPCSSWRACARPPPGAG